MNKIILFHCERRSLKLTADNCAQYHNQARREAVNDPCHRLHQCLDCEIGAKYAGVEPYRSVPRICVRCHEQPRRLISGCFCPTCYNRLNEIKLNRTRRKPPRPISVFFSFSKTLKRMQTQHQIAFTSPNGLTKVVAGSVLEAALIARMGQPDLIISRNRKAAYV